MTSSRCPVCDSNLNSGIQPWHRECPTCSYQAGDLPPAINVSSAHQQIDEKSRETGLRALRSDNFRRLIEAIKTTGMDSGKLLDVGCAHGWFIEIARNNGFEASGMEPDEDIYTTVSAKGLSVRKGFFPDALTVDERFNVITFNDVFEHIPDISKVLAGCSAHLTPEGLLVLNLPSSAGPFYRTSRIFAKLGFSGFFERLWQKGLPSPHLHYFNTENLRLLLESNGFRIRRTGRLPAIRLTGLRTRISYTGNYPAPVRALIYCVAALSLPILRLLPSDIVYIIAQKDRCSAELPESTRIS